MTKNELTNILKEIWDEKDFITGVQLCLSNDEERQMLADAITAGIIRNGMDAPNTTPYCQRLPRDAASQSMPRAAAIMPSPISAAHSR